MPEGDVVARTAARVDAALSGQELTGSDFRVPAYAHLQLAGWTVLATVSRGKHLLTRLTPPAGADTSPLTVHTHLRMEGSWHLYRVGGRRTGGPDWQIRLILSTATWRAVGLRLGMVDVVPTAGEDTLVGHLGPDLLGPDWDEEEALRRLRTEPDRPIGDALLDQRRLAGIGTLYRAESLFLAGISPMRPVGEVEQLPDLLRLARRLLEAGRRTGEQAATGDPRPGHEHWVFQRARRPCRRCGTPVQVGETGVPPQARTVFWCPRCQPGPAAPPAVSATGALRSPVDSRHPPGGRRAGAATPGRSRSRYGR